MKSELFVVCLNNADYPASLESRKLYRVVPDADAAQLSMIRVIDESGEDYLYPAALFSPIFIPKDLQRLLLAA